MTENPTTTLGNYDLLAERGQQGFVLSPSIPGEGLKISGQRPRGSFARAAEKPAANNPAAYDDQSMLGQILINILMMITGKLDADKSGNNQLMSLISKAFGMQDDSNHTEFRQLQKDVQTRGREKVRGERDFSKFDQESATAAVRHNNTYSTTPVNADTYQKFIHGQHKKLRSTK